MKERLTQRQHQTEVLSFLYPTGAPIPGGERLQKLLSRTESYSRITEISRHRPKQTENHYGHLIQWRDLALPSID